MSKTPEYWKAYRLKNCDKLRAYEKVRNARRNGARKPLEASKPPAPSLVEVSIPKPVNPITCCLCTSKGEHKGFYQGALSLFCSKHWKV